MYFGQQNITAVAPTGVTGNTITSESEMNAITYQVSANPVAEAGTWSANRNNENSAFNQFGQHRDALLATTTNGYNYPINVYPAGSYGYTVSPQGGDAGRASETTVKYPAGLGTSVAANFKGTDAASSTTTVTNESSSLQ